MRTIALFFKTLVLGIFNLLNTDAGKKHDIKVSTFGVINRGILGGFSGKVANVIGGSWKGIAYMRSQPLSVSNPNTASQVAQRTAFSDTVAIAQIALTNIIKPFMDRFASSMSGFNYFVQQNIGAWVSAGVFTWANLKFSIGSLTPLSTFAVTAANASPNMQITWVDNSGTGTALASDVVQTIGYNETQNTWKVGEAVMNRPDAASTLPFDANFATNDVIHAWGVVKSALGDKVANSVHATVTV